MEGIAMTGLNGPAAQALRVSDVMTTSARTVTLGTPLRGARETMLKQQVSCLPVVTWGGRVVGMLSAQDCVDPKHDLDDTMVEHAMGRVLYAVRADAPLIDAVHLMVRQGTPQVLVVDDRGALLGQVTSMEVLRAAAARGPQASTIPLVKLT
jgi:CBS domain-containing protein